MIFIIESVILCALFTLAIMMNMRDPIRGIMSYPPAIRERVESLPQYQGTIHREERAHIAKKLLSVPVFAIIIALLCWLGGTRTFLHAFLYGFSACFWWATCMILWFSTSFGFAAAKRFDFPEPRIWIKNIATRGFICVALESA